jgi:hypothetical protein
MNSILHFFSTAQHQPQHYQNPEQLKIIKNLPLIAVIAATTTRKVKNPSTKNLALFTLLLPSLMRSLDCGFRYEYVLGYDVGDPFYDSTNVSSYSSVPL